MFYKKPINKFHIAVEGIDGCGKSSFVNELKNDLYSFSSKIDENLYNMYCDTSPYDPSLNTVIRKMLKNEYKMNNKELHEELLSLFMLDNYIHSTKIEEIVKERNPQNIVISDRFIASTFAYQSLNNSKKKIIKTLNKYDIKFPGLILFFDIPISESMKRIDKRGEEKEIFEKEESLKKIKERYVEGFRTINKLTGGKTVIIRIDATKPKEVVFENAKIAINEYFKYDRNKLRSLYSDCFDNIIDSKNKFSVMIF